jgi:hypothetical protein
MTSWGRHNEAAMTYATLGAARQVVFVRRPPGEVDGGTIYDDRLIAALSAAGVRVRAVIAARRSTADTLLAAAAHGTSPRFCRYTWRPDEIADDDYADVIVSHESAMLPVLGLPPSRRVFLIFHNLPTAFDDERRASAGGLFAPLAGPLQRRLLKRHNTIPVLLSAREIAIARREAPGADLRYLPPGMPVHFSLPRTRFLPNSSSLAPMTGPSSNATPFGFATLLSPLCRPAFAKLRSGMSTSNLRLRFATPAPSRYCPTMAVSGSGLFPTGFFPG